jgi:hypothetical protein
MSERSDLWVAAVRGWDLTETPEAWNPVRLIGGGYELLALDRTAAAHLLEAGLPFRTVEDWLHDHGGDLTEVLERSAMLHERWLTGRGDLLRTEGVDWPELDHWHVPNLWLSMTVVVRLSEALRAAGIRRLRISVGHPFDTTAPGHHPDPTISEGLQLLIADAIEAVPVPPGSSWRLFRQLVSDSPVGASLRIVRRLRDSARFRRTERELRTRLRTLPLALVMLPKRELERSRPILDALRSSEVVDLTIVPWMASTDLAAEAAALHDLPWLPTPPLERGRLADERRFRIAVERSLQDIDLEELAQVRAALGAGLSRLSRRWAAELRRLRWTRTMLRRVGPALVVAGRDDIAYHIPIIAATQSGVPTMTLPHGVVEWWPPERFTAPGPTAHVAGVRNPIAPDGAVTPCADAFIAYEYPHRVEHLSSLDGGERAITIALITEGYGELSIVPELRAHRDALHAVVAAASALDRKVRLLLKTHPGNPEDERFLLPQTRGCEVIALPRSADLIELITDSDLVIGVNTIGSALAHAVRAGAPVLRLTTRSLLGAGGAAWRNWTAWSEFWDESLVTVREGVELHTAIQEVLGDAAVLESLRTRSSRAAARFATEDRTPEIGAIVRELLGRS